MGYLLALRHLMQAYPVNANFREIKVSTSTIMSMTECGAMYLSNLTVNKNMYEVYFSVKWCLSLVLETFSPSYNHNLSSEYAILGYLCARAIVVQNNIV